MTNNKELNIIKHDNIQNFMDVIYYFILPNIQKNKIITLLDFNWNEYNSIIYCIKIFQNENKETFIKLINYLKNKYE